MATAPTRPDERALDEPVESTATPSAERQPRYGQPFFPAVPFGASIYISFLVIALVLLALTNPAPLQNPADPLNHEHINPRPEWYFLFLFQLLKVFQGPWEIVGTAVLPGIATVVLLLLPFYDRNWSRRAARRPIAVGIAGLSIIGLAFLTYLPISSTPAPVGSDYLTAVAAHPHWANIQAIFAKNCSGCHVGVSTYLGGLNLSSYDGAIKGGTGGGPITGPVIKPGNAQGSYLWQVVSWRPYLYKVGANMPLGGPQIPKTDRDNIANWINDGAKNQ